LIQCWNCNGTAHLIVAQIKPIGGNSVAAWITIIKKEECLHFLPCSKTLFCSRKQRFCC
jgi:hypothetical protein